MVSNQFGPSGQMVPRIFFLSRGTGCGDPEIRGPNWLGAICLGVPNVWGPFVVKGDRKWGTGSRASNGFRTKCVVAVLNGIVRACLGLLTLIRIIKPVIKFDMTAPPKRESYYILKTKDSI